MTKSVQLETKTADLATDFGREWATKLFGAEAIASLPVRLAGKNKGAPKGHVIWRKASAAGYCREIQSPVAAGQLVDAWIGTNGMASRSEAMSGMWGGRIQPIAGSRAYLLEEGLTLFAREAAQRAQDLDDALAAADRRAAERGEG